MPNLKELLPDNVYEKLMINSTVGGNTGSGEEGQNVVGKEVGQPTTSGEQALTQKEIEEIFSCIDQKSVDVHKKVVKEMKWADCIHPLSILPKPNQGECYGFYNYGRGRDGFLHYDINGVHYYVVALYKKEYIKKVNEKTANQETLTSTKFYVVGSNGTCFGPCKENLYSGGNEINYEQGDTITSNKGLKKYVNKEIGL